MNTIDLTPLYRSSVGFDRLASLIDHALTTETNTNAYPALKHLYKPDHQA